MKLFIKTNPVDVMSKNQSLLYCYYSNPRHVNELLKKQHSIKNNPSSQYPQSALARERIQ